MSRIARSYGDQPRNVLAFALDEHMCTETSFAAHLSTPDRNVSRETVHAWRAGSVRCPSEILFPLVAHVGVEHAPRLLQFIADLATEPLGIGLRVGVPEIARDASDVLVHAAQGSGAMGQLVGHLMYETSPSSPGGVERTLEEYEARLPYIAGAKLHLAQIEQDTAEGIRRCRVA
jgi:hypothetical protein